MQAQYIPTHKTCRLCGESKPIDDFPKASDSSDGRRPRCKDCHAAANRAYNKRIKEEQPERVKEWAARNYQNHKAEYRERNKQWIEAHPERVREIDRAKGRRNRHIKMRWDAKKRGAIDEGVTKDSLLELRAYFDDRCAYCNKQIDNPPWDHIVPISFGGRHHPENLVPACTSCNSKKYRASLLVCLLERRFP